MIKEPLIFYLTAPEVSRYDLSLPNGKRLIFNQSTQYKTEDKEEQDFLSQQKYIGVKRMNDKEFRQWATLQFDSIPTIYNRSIQSKEDIEEHLWTSESEDYAINKLKESGYTVFKRNYKKK
jgi:hypothetical protein